MRISDWSSDVCSSDLIAAEAILVELLVRFDIPQPAAVGADLVGEDDAAVIVIPDAAEFELEIDEADADAREQPAQEIVGAYRQIGDVVQHLLSRPAAASGMPVGAHRIAERIILDIQFDDREWEQRKGVV